MATFKNGSQVAIPSIASSSNLTGSPEPWAAAPVDGAVISPTLSPGHAAILEMHANSQSNAITYIVVVLVLYVLGMTVVLVKYIRTERYEARLTRLFQNIMRRDRFFRVSRRRSSIPPKDTAQCAPCTTVADEVPPSPTFYLTDENGDEIEAESEL